MTRAVTLFALLAICTDPAAADLATVAFTSDETGSFPKTVQADRSTITVNLSALGKDVKVLRAVLIPAGAINGRYGRDKPEPITVTVAGAKDPLPLLPPRFKGFVCTGAVADAVKAGAGKIAFKPVSLRGYDRANARLEVTCTIAAKTKIPRVTGIRATHRAGQTFITFAEPNPAVRDEKINSEQFAAVLAKLAKDSSKVAFRIYRHTAPITATTIAQAQRIDQIGPLTCWNSGIQGHYTLRAKGDRAIDLPRYVVREADGPVSPGTGVYAHNPKKAGKAYYAVTVAVGGEEDLSAFDAGNATADAVAETVGQGVPVLQRQEVIKPGGNRRSHHFYNNNCTRVYFVRWEAPPNANLPSKPLNYLVGVPVKRVAKAPVAIRLHGWGGTMFGGGFWPDPDKGTLLMSTNQIPYDWWTGYHEYSWTWRSWSEGVVRDYSQTRLLSFVDWMDTKYGVDMTRVSVGGGSMGGSGTTNLAVHHAKRIAWANGTVGVHIPDSSPQFTSSYIHSYGQVKWQLPYKTTGVSAFNWFSNEWYVSNHVGEDLPLIVFSNGKNDGQIGWPQAVRFVRALQKARQAHVFKWGMGGHGEGTRLPGPGSGGRSFKLDVRTNRTLPAFTQCSLDGDLGTAKRKPEAEYQKQKKEIAQWNKDNPRARKYADRYDGDTHGMFNGYLYWDTSDKNIVDEPGRWSLILALDPKAPKDDCTVNVTPRRCQQFKAKPGEKFTWTNEQGSRLAGSGAKWTRIQTGTAEADKFGLLTLQAVKVSKVNNRIVLKRK